MKKLVNTRIPAEQAKLFNPIALPAIDGANVVEVVKTKPQSNRDWRKTVQKQKSKGLPSTMPETVDESPSEQQQELSKAREQATLEGYTEGLEQGREKGHQQGYQEGLAKAQQESKQLASRIEDMLKAFSDPMQLQQQELQSAVMNVAINIAQSVIQRELAMPSEALSNVVDNALKALPSGATNIRIHMHPNDIECLKVLQPPSWQDFQWVPDAKCQLGDCVIHTQQSSVDFSVSERFRQVIHQLFDTWDQDHLVQDYQPLPSPGTPVSEETDAVQNEQEEGSEPN